MTLNYESNSICKSILTDKPPNSRVCRNFRTTNRKKMIGTTPKVTFVNVVGVLHSKQRLL